VTNLFVCHLRKWIILIAEGQLNVQTNPLGSYYIYSPTADLSIKGDFYAKELRLTYWMAELSSVFSFCCEYPLKELSISLVRPRDMSSDEVEALQLLRESTLQQLQLESNFHLFHILSISS